MLKLLHPNVVIYVDAVLRHDFGIIPSKAELEMVFNGSDNPDDESNTSGNFILRVPTLGSSSKWHFLFNCSDLKQPPEVVSGDNIFHNFTSAELIEKLPSLSNWPCEKSTALLTLVLELLQLYKDYQVKLLKSSHLERVNFHYESLLSMLTGGEITDLDVVVHSNNAGVAFVEICVGLLIDVTELPLPNPNHTLLALFFTLKSHSSEIIPNIWMWDELQAILGRLPTRIFQQDTSFLDYIPEVKKDIERKINKCKMQWVSRRALLSQFLSHVQPNLLYLDSKFYNEISFYIENGVDSVITIVKVCLPDEFPESKPVVKCYYTNGVRVEETLVDVLLRSNNFKKMAYSILKKVESKFSNKSST